MDPKPINDMGGWRSIAAGFIILTFLILGGLLAFSGHSPHLYVAVGYVLVAAFVLARMMPRQADAEDPSDPDAGFRFEMIDPGEPSACQWYGREADRDKEMK